MLGGVEDIQAARLFEELNAFPSDVCRKHIQKFGKGEITRVI